MPLASDDPEPSNVPIVPPLLGPSLVMTTVGGCVSGNVATCVVAARLPKPDESWAASALTPTDTLPLPSGVIVAQYLALLPRRSSVKPEAVALTEGSI